jgi:hypothetical protein
VADSKEQSSVRTLIQKVTTPAFVALLFGVISAVASLPDVVDRLREIYILLAESPVLVFVALGVLVILIISFFTLFILIRGRLTETASSLGYSSSESPEDDRDAEKKTRYTPDDMLSPLLIARSRLLDHINTLRNNAVTNLFMGIGIASIGIIILFWAIIQIGSMQLEDAHNINTTRVVALVMFPKLSITVFIQIFSYFFLAMYRSNQQEIRYFQNEITMIDSFAAALIASNKSSPALKVVLTALAKNERNRVLKKGEKPIVSSDEVELIHAMSILSRIKEASNLSDK